ncbi:hypothetical protein ACWFMI_18195 [Nocardiopsis terrae]
MVRPRHPDKDLESVLKGAEARGWRVERRKKYYKMYCPCQDKHFKTVKLSPSGANYLKDLLGQLRRATCWEEQDR